MPLLPLIFAEATPAVGKDLFQEHFIVIMSLSLVAAGWTLICFLISRSGWGRFARAYGDARSQTGPVFKSPSIMFGSPIKTYRNMVKVAPCVDGIRFSIILISRAFHPPFLLPWDSVKKIERLRSASGTPFVLITVQDAAGMMTVYLRAEFLEAASEHCPSLVERIK